MEPRSRRRSKGKGVKQESPPSSLYDGDTSEELDRDNNDSDISDPPDHDRSNKYEGAKSTWRAWTANERAVAQSLDRLRTQNLSVHLYNAFCLHKRAQQGRRRARDKTGAARNEKQSTPYEPSLVWSAWPMYVETVPRQFESRFGSCNGVPTIRKPGDGMSSRQNLEDILTAVISKQARESSGDHGFNAVSYTGLGTTVAYLVRSSQLDSLSPDNRQFGPEGEQAPGNHSPTERPEEANNELQTESQPPRALRPVDLGDYASDLSFEDQGEADPVEETREFAPYPVIDEDKVTTLLQRPVRHTLTQLDRLLMALHYSRESYTRSRFPKTKEPEDEPLADVRSEHVSDTKMAHSSGSDEAGQESDSPVSGQSTTRKKATTSPPGGGEIKRRKTSTDARSNTYKSRRDLRANEDALMHYGSRRWDEVLGFAALAGWDEQIVQRARARCERIFGENMDDWCKVEDPLLDNIDGTGSQPQQVAVDSLASDDEPQDTESEATESDEL